MNINKQLIIDNTVNNWVVSNHKTSIKEMLIDEAFTNAFNAGIEKYFPEFICDTSVSIISWQYSNDGLELSEVDYGIINPNDLFQLLGEVETWVNNNIGFLTSRVENIILKIGLNNDDKEDIAVGL
ncbi:hypothetical protein [Methylobacter psychrophilus]|uniref:hypothetical protein n=1 Tax=Methylobacter psychrophilus TaxID=96941 RepID=UPI0021D48A00|nr:hypothetical protein [Methylobacter psychrophilus]